MKPHPAILLLLTTIFLAACAGVLSAPQTPPVAESATATHTGPAPTATYYTYQTPTIEGPIATIIISLDLGGGGAGFSANLYAQEVSIGKTFGVFLSAGMHGAAALPTSAPMVMHVAAPGTYVFYARLSNAPTDYFYGFTDCVYFGDCDAEKHRLKAIDVFPGMTYQVVIDGDRKVLLPERDQPVSVPWGK